MLQELMSQQSFSDAAPALWGALFGSVMGDRSKVEDEDALPQTGMPAAVEQELSSIFVDPFDLGVGAFCSLTAKYRLVSTVMWLAWLLEIACSGCMAETGDDG